MANETMAIIAANNNKIKALQEQNRKLRAELSITGDNYAKLFGHSGIYRGMPKICSSYIKKIVFATITNGCPTGNTFCKNATSEEISDSKKTIEEICGILVGMREKYKEKFT